jgi:fucose permease
MMASTSSRRVMAIGCGIFLALGLVTAAIGPVLPDMARATGGSLATLGGLFTALFTGALLAQLVAGAVIDRLGPRAVLLVGLTVFAGGVAGMAASTALWAAFACATFAGLGHGAVDIATNLLIAETFAARRASALNLLNVFFGLGAIAGPVCASLALRTVESALPALWIGAGLLALMIPLTALLPRQQPGGSEALPAQAARGIYASPLLWAFGVLTLIYVGVENGLGGWTTAYVEYTTALAADQAALIASGFWLALTAGRVVASGLGLRLAPPRLLLLSLLGALVGAALLALSVGNLLGTVAGVLLVGFCFGPIFPTLLAIVTGHFRQAPGRAAGVIVALASVGGMTLPYLHGLLLTGVGPWAAALFVAGGNLAMLLLFLAGGRHAGEGMAATRRSQPLAAPAAADGLACSPRRQ